MLMSSCLEDFLSDRRALEAEVVSLKQRLADAVACVAQLDADAEQRVEAASAHSISQLQQQQLRQQHQQLAQQQHVDAMVTDWRQDKQQVLASLQAALALAADASEQAKVLARERDGALQALQQAQSSAAATPSTECIPSLSSSPSPSPSLSALTCVVRVVDAGIVASQRAIRVPQTRDGLGRDHDDNVSQQHHRHHSDSAPALALQLDVKTRECEALQRAVTELATQLTVTRSSIAAVDIHATAMEAVLSHCHPPGQAQDSRTMVLASAIPSLDHCPAVVSVAVEASRALPHDVVQVRCKACPFGVRVFACARVQAALNGLDLPSSMLCCHAARDLSCAFHAPACLAGACTGG
jgi:hypothetical protein